MKNCPVCNFIRQSKDALEELGGYVPFGCSTIAWYHRDDNLIYSMNSNGTTQLLYCPNCGLPINEIQRNAEHLKVEGGSD